MPSAKTNHEDVPETQKTSGKAATPTLMDDAPLFAGLDSFVLIQAKNKRAEPPSKVREKPAPRQKRAATAEPSAPSPQKAPKAPPQPGPNTILLSVAEMCSLLRISRATLIRMDKAGKLPGRIKLGGSVRFHRETVEAWLKELITPPAP